MTPNACAGKTLYCPPNHDCIVQCQVATACRQSIVHAEHSSSLSIHVAAASSAAQQLTIYTPNPANTNYKTSALTCNSDAPYVSLNQCTDITVFATRGFTDIELKCNDGSALCEITGSMHCGQDSQYSYDECTEFLYLDEQSGYQCSNYNFCRSSTTISNLNILRHHGALLTTTATSIVFDKEQILVEQQDGTAPDLQAMVSPKDNDVGTTVLVISGTLLLSCLVLICLGLCGCMYVRVKRGNLEESIITRGLFSFAKPKFEHNESDSTQNESSSSCSDSDESTEDDETEPVDEEIVIDSNDPSPQLPHFGDTDDHIIYEDSECCALPEHHYDIQPPHVRDEADDSFDSIGITAALPGDEQHEQHMRAIYNHLPPSNQHLNELITDGDACTQKDVEDALIVDLVIDIHNKMSPESGSEIHHHSIIRPRCSPTESMSNDSETNLHSDTPPEAITMLQQEQSNESLTSMHDHVHTDEWQPDEHKLCDEGIDDEEATMTMRPSPPVPPPPPPPTEALAAMNPIALTEKQKQVLLENVRNRAKCFGYQQPDVLYEEEENFTDDSDETEETMRKKKMFSMRKKSKSKDTAGNPLKITEMMRAAQQRKASNTQSFTDDLLEYGEMDVAKYMHTAIGRQRSTSTSRSDFRGNEIVSDDELPTLPAMLSDQPWQ